MNIKTSPHMRHNYRMGVSEEKRRAVQYAMDKRREERGTKVIHVHEKPPAAKVWPSHADIEARVLEYFRVRGELPRILQVPFQTSWSSMAWPVSGLPPDPASTLKDGRRLVELQIELSDALGLR